MEENNLEIINKLAQFVVNRTTTELREELQEYLVIVSILESKDNPTVREICEFLSNKLGVKEFPERIVIESLERLIDKNQVRKIQENNLDHFKAENLIEKKITGYSIEYNSIVDKFFNEIFKNVEKYHRPLTEVEKKQIQYSILISFGVIFKSFGVEVASIFYRGRLKEIHQTKFDDFCIIIKNNLNKFIPEENIKQCIIEVISHSFEKPSLEFSKFLFSLSQAYYLVEILNLDPEGQKLIYKKFSNKKLFLDTNVVINLIFDIEKKKEKIRKKELDLARFLKYNIFVTKRTIAEFNTWMEDQKKSEKIIEKIEIPRFEKTQHILEDGALKDFLIKKINQPSLTWKGYLAKFAKIEDILLKNYGISIDNSFDSVLQGEEKTVQYLIPILQSYSHKSDNVAQHDAAHIIFIQKIRDITQQDILGPNCWFLTNDSSLYNVEREYHPQEIPSTIFGAHWIQMISPFLSPDVSKDDGAIVFARIFNSSFTTSHIIDEARWLKIQGSWLDIEGLSSEMIEDVIGTNYVQEFLKKKPEEIDQEELALSIDKAFVEGYKRQEQEKIELVKEKDMLIENHTQQLSKLEADIELQKKKINDIKINQKTQKSELIKDKRTTTILFLLFFFASLAIDLGIFTISQEIWSLIYQIIIPIELSIIGITSGLNRWFNRQIKKFYINNY